MKAYIVHGYTASPEKHWFPWLAQQLEQRGIVCESLSMPDSNSPDPDKWLAHLLPLVVDEKTILIGHSLGCIAILNWLAKTAATPAVTLFVSGFHQPLSTLPELTPFTTLYHSLPRPKIGQSYVIAALDDHIVPHHYSDSLAQHLHADYIRLDKGGHFLDREGWLQFPLVMKLLEKHLS